jgi:GntR family transcriptional regulator / MocR family aminotransferase
MEPDLALALRLPPPGSRRLTHELRGQLRTAIVDGRLKGGVRLPSTRTLAAALGISRNSVMAAYRSLVDEGYIATRPAGGTHVADVARGGRVPAARRPVAPAAPAPAPACDFRLGVPDQRALDWATWRRLSSRALRRLARESAVYPPPNGQPALRQAIAQHLSFARAVSCDAGDVVVTSGAQQAFDLIARHVVTPGKTVVAVEDPGYPPAWAAFRAAGATLVPVRVDGEGLIVDEVPREARIVYVTPAHQFPLGAALSARRRAALLEFARAQRAFVVEDDYDGEFRYDGHPHDALKTIDRSDCVFLVGTFSKSLFPSLRLGYVVPPLRSLAALVELKRHADGHCNVAAQETLAAFAQEGHLAGHVRRVRKRYAARRRQLIEALEGPLAPWLERLPGTSGLHVAARLRMRTDVMALVDAARAAGVGVYPLHEYRFGARGAQALLFGYGAVDEAAMGAGLARLRRVLAERLPLASTKAGSPPGT